MPTNSFEALSPSDGLDRVGSAADYSSVGPTTRYDSTLHLPLSTLLEVPGMLPPAPILPTPPVPTEAQLRDQLVAALAVQHGRETELARAAAAHQRAIDHHERCTRRLAEYAGLSDAIAQSVIGALRCSPGVLNTDLSEEHEQALTDRTTAEAELDAAGTALNTFRSEWAEASQAAGDATRQVETLITKVLGHPAEQVAARYQELLAEIETVRNTLIAFDHFRTRRGASAIGAPIAVQRVWSTLDPSVFARRQDLSAWNAAADALRADAYAEVTIEPIAVQPATEAA
jgi:hypothetical protein